ncbi:hypothetical protein EGR_11242 [Echinococcus granulosus]|uniref:Uncharacterized protein n=1 Tax=Echinococcus granulosus TaxID=6210 RepID=W6U0B8_ECHGR|nr:hypothetical protein EGR_11242 [Echinococcus granulosus]EUB53901.1 hypothetical protein EGR_11242 [Echinococcus granulosus]
MPVRSVRREPRQSIMRLSSAFIRSYSPSLKKGVYHLRSIDEMRWSVPMKV